MSVGLPVGGRAATHHRGNGEVAAGLFLAHAMRQPSTRNGLHFYTKLLRLANKHKVETLLDTDGDPLLHGLEGHPTIVKPNQSEASAFEYGADYTVAIDRCSAADQSAGAEIGSAFPRGARLDCGYSDGRHFGSASAAN